MIKVFQKAVLAALLSGIRPDPVLSVSEHAEKHRVLSQVAAAEYGPWRNARTPYLVAIMDSLSVDSPTEYVTFMAGAQVGKTECGNNWIHYVVTQAPGPMLSVLPTVDMAKDNSKTRIDPLFEESELIQERGLIRPAKSRESGNTVQMKEFPGGFLCMTGANSPATLRSKPIRYLNLDEVDGYPGDVGGEGDPCELAEVRTRTFGNRKILKTSTPTIEITSRIERSFLKGTQEYYHVPCPDCGHYQPLKWSQIKWDSDLPIDKRPESARFVCIECGSLIENHQKERMLALGRWVAENPDAGPRHRSFHLSSLYSPVGWFSWSDCVEKFLAAKAEGRESLVTFVNTVLGETWKDKGEVPEWKSLYNRRRRYEVGTIPTSAAMLTAGADVQKDRIEVEVVAYGEPRRSWSIDYLVLEGDPQETAVWEKLAALLERDFQHETGAPMRIEKLCIDSGYLPSPVYRFARRFRKRVLATKGQDNYTHLLGQPRALDLTANAKSRKKIRRGVYVYPVGASKGKMELYAALRAEEPARPVNIAANVVPGSAEFPADAFAEYPPEWCEFPDYYEESWFKMLCSEQLVKRTRRSSSGRTLSGISYQWEKLQERNEALDCRVLARAAACAAGIETMEAEDWKKRLDGLHELAADLSGLVKKAPRKKSPDKGKGIMDGCPDLRLNS